MGEDTPAVIADLRLDLTLAQWINSVYAVVFVALLLTAGRLSVQSAAKGWMLRQANVARGINNRLKHHPRSI